MGREVVAGEAVYRDIGDSKHARLILYAKEIGGPRSPGCFISLTGVSPWAPPVPGSVTAGPSS